ncbi:MAG: tyrosine-type recombinase/integrase [Paracoccaceae bacterium]
MANGLTRRAGKVLSAAFVRSVQEPGKYHDGGGTGLFLRVDPNGARFWVQRITIRGKRRELGLGSPSTVTLAEVREKAQENRKLARAGGDPLADKRAARAMLTFAEAARKTHEELAPTWKNPKDRAAFLTTLEMYMFPRFGNISLQDVTSAEVRQAILAARLKAPGVARKLVYRTSHVFRWGIAEGLCAGNPATTESLALPRMNIKPKHRKALPYSEVSGCIDTVNASGAWASTKLALEFLILTASRSGEVRGARWDEIDHGGKGATCATWEIPADRMKMRKPHRIPISPRATEILREAETLVDASGLIFPSVRGKVLSDMTLSKLVKELGFDADVHGFRTSFRTWAQEQTNYPREIAEAALAHGIKDKAEAAYARSDVFEKRRKMMESWAAYLAGRRGELVKLATIT